ncbi:hypothetical protein KDD30_18405 (plasmid) [Photobacterium sp. GJ3]|uniref:urease accessory protein UreF n=1 Tax=Photobacterium sp. GJ3 TaxID=2829502 RepID=UPI001B8CAA58|nr:urease accessory UreF family protein [Photobacterium sp. GJ3]QUJ70118.1 hypothetical protein KDD30_18405 [Photobacterium sp. GJ3]
MLWLLNDGHTTAEFRLFQLISPSLPIDAFTYSQGLEWAVDHGWVRDKASLADWLRNILNQSLTPLELPALRRLYQAWETGDLDAVRDWKQWLYACRETNEKQQRGRATATLLAQLGVSLPGQAHEAPPGQSSHVTVISCQSFRGLLGRGLLGQTL